MNDSTRFIPITEDEELKAAGIDYPNTVDGWRWAYRKREERGLAKAFKRQGRRILVDTAAYLDAVRAS